MSRRNGVVNGYDQPIIECFLATLFTIDKDGSDSATWSINRDGDEMP